MAITLSPNRKQQAPRARCRTQRGFTLLEVMVAMGLLVVALVSLAGVFAYGFATVQTSQYDMLAKAEAKEVMESIFAARNSGQIAFKQIDNVGGGNPDALFLTGYKPATREGLDGLFNTAGTITGGTSKDTPPESINTPGPDGILGTSDDVAVPFTFMQRQIEIAPYYTDLKNKITSPSLKQVTVSVQYQAGRFGQKTYVMTTYISQFR